MIIATLEGMRFLMVLLMITGIVLRMPVNTTGCYASNISVSNHYGRQAGQTIPDTVSTTQPSCLMDMVQVTASADIAEVRNASVLFHIAH